MTNQMRFFEYEDGCCWRST